MLLGSPLRPAISRRGSASPDDRKAESSREAWTTDLTRYGSRADFSVLMTALAPRFGAARRLTRARFCPRTAWQRQHFVSLSKTPSWSSTTRPLEAAAYSCLHNPVFADFTANLTAARPRAAVSVCQTPGLP